MPRKKRSDKFLKRHIAKMEKVLFLKKQHEIEFDTQWLEDIKERLSIRYWLTEAQIQAIDNALGAIKNMVRYKKLVERRKKKCRSRSNPTTTPV